MFRTLDRYLLRSFISNYVLALFTLISLYVVLDLFINLDEFTESGKPIIEVVENAASYYAYNIPLYFSQLSGVIVSFAACLTLVRLQRQNEMTAVVASGTSLYRLAAPIVLAAFLMNALLVLDQEVLIPSIAPKLARSRDDVEGMRVYEVWFVRDGEQRLLSAQAFSVAEKKIRGLIILELQPDGQLGDVIRADKAIWNEEKHGWDLVSGKRLEMLGDSVSLATAERPIRSKAEFFYATNLTPDELKLRQTAQWVQFLSVRQLAELERRKEVQSQQIAQIKHSRFTLPINNMVLLLMGLPFFLTRLPGSVLNSAAKALVACGIAFMTAFVGQQLVGGAGFSPALPAWMPIFLFGPVSVLLLDNIKT